MSENINKIIYINLDYRTDRRKQIEDELDRYNLKSERFAAISNPFGALGCAQSHLEVLKQAKEKGYQNVLILEDDFTFTVTKEIFEENLKLFFNLDLQYDVCLFSYNLVHGKATEIKDIPFLKKITGTQTASGYLIKQHYYDTLINLFERNMPNLEKTKNESCYAIDQVWKSLQEKDNWYCFEPRLGKQRASYSDNCKMMVNYDC